MNESLYLNKISYRLKQEKRPNYLFWISIVFTFLLISSCSISVRLSKKTTAIYKEETNTLEIIWNYDEIDKLNMIEKVKIEEIETDFKIKNMSEIKVIEEKQINYQIIEIESPKTFRNNQVLHLLLLDKKEKIIKKLKKIIVGG